MTFLHPWAIVMGVLAAGVPTAIHFLTRPRPVRMPLSTLRFVQDAVRQRRSWHRFRDILLLALRTLAVLLIALAVARPQWGNRSLISDVQAGDAVRVVILDVSQSMGAADGAVEQIERARTMAANYLRYRSGLAANLIVAGARAEAVFDGPSTNFEALREELARCRALPQRLDVARALDLSARMLAPASVGDRRRRELVVVSDFQRSSWTKADFSVLSADTQIQLESTAPAKTLPNLAILRVEGQTARSTSGNVQLEIEVGNYSPIARKVSVEVTLGDASRRISGMCPAGQSTTLTEEIDIRGAGWQSGEARLVGIDDALGADNVYSYVIHVRPKPTYAILTRQPATQRPSSSHFLECALVPDGQFKEKASATVLRLEPSAVDQAALAPADLILLDHPGRLSDETARLLAGLMRRGRPILYVASELIDATNLKKLSELAGSGLQMPIEFAPPPSGQIRRDLFYTSVRRENPAFRVFGDNLTAVLGRLRFTGGLASRRLENGLENDILATYNDGSAGVVITSSDAGAMAVINADLGASNLPRTSAFVPMLNELVTQMLDRGRAADSAFCGEPLAAQLPADAGASVGLRVVGPETLGADNDANARGELVDEAVSTTWRWPSPSRPGVYRVLRGDATVFSLAVHIPPEESQLDGIKPEVLTGRLGAGRNIVFRGAEDNGPRHDDFWWWFAAACVVCMLGETSVLLAFRT
ncbi:MAG: BatA and WFA domain-containing protein [Thermoguttaceae bacterium]|jgi:hypothetical protein